MDLPGAASVIPTSIEGVYVRDVSLADIDRFTDRVRRGPGWIARLLRILGFRRRGDRIALKRAHSQWRAMVCDADGNEFDNCKAFEDFSALGAQRVAQVTLAATLALTDVQPGKLESDSPTG